MYKLDSRVEQVQAAYKAAVEAGEIDPKQVDIERYAAIISDDIEYEIGAEPNRRDEVVDSKIQVANLQIGGDAREGVLRKWFDRAD